jgi:seryl-tRNA synthetase
MLDIKLVRETPDIIRQDLEKRGASEKMQLLEHVITWDEEWRSELQLVEDLRRKRNELTKEVANLKKAGQDVKAKVEEAARLPLEIEKAEKEVDALKEKITRGLMRLPNILHESVPIGASDADNIEVKTWGEPKVPSFELMPHGEFMEHLGVADFERARKVAGAGFFYLKGPLALMDIAIVQFAFDYLVKKGYTPVLPPYMLRRGPYEGVVDLGDFESMMYKIEGEDMYLIATSEHPIGAMYQGEIIDEDLLPMKFAGYSTCFRKEIGAHGVDTKGLFRIHQFNKVEQFVFCRPEDSWKFHEELLSNAEALFQQLGIPYRVVNVCTGDIGTIAAKKYDIEAWFPRTKSYGEVVSCSNCTDYQARRLNIRCGKVGGEKRFLHTLNSTAIATSRALRAIFENYQRADGSLEVPPVLRDYMGGLERIEPEGSVRAKK